MAFLSLDTHQKKKKPNKNQTLIGSIYWFQKYINIVRMADFYVSLEGKLGREAQQPIII